MHGGELLLRQRDVAEHACQDVVEIVGDPTREHAEAFEFAGMLPVPVDHGLLLPYLFSIPGYLLTLSQQGAQA